MEAAKGRIPAFVDTGLNLVHVDDVANGHLAAMRSGKIGERYILGGENVLFSQMLKDIAGIVGRRAPWVRLPWRALVPVAFARGSRGETSQDASPLRPWTGFIWRDIACSLLRPKPSGSYHTVRGLILREFKTLCSGFVPLDT